MIFILTLLLGLVGWLDSLGLPFASYVGIITSYREQLKSSFRTKTNVRILSWNDCHIERWHFLAGSLNNTKSNMKLGILENICIEDLSILYLTFCVGFRYRYPFVEGRSSFFWSMAWVISTAKIDLSVCGHPNRFLLIVFNTPILRLWLLLHMVTTILTVITTKVWHLALSLWLDLLIKM